MFATGPRAVGFTIVWPEGVIFSSMMTYHAQFLLLVVAGWVNRQQQDVIDYLQEENRVLRAGLRGKRLKLSDDERRRLAVKAQALGREALAQNCVRCHTRALPRFNATTDPAATVSSSTVFPGASGYAVYLAPSISRRDEGLRWTPFSGPKWGVAKVEPAELNTSWS